MTEVEKPCRTAIETDNINVTEDGKAALLELSNGHMRRALDVLQACHAAYDMTDETAVYTCTGTQRHRVRGQLDDEFGTCYQSEVHSI